MIVLLFVIASYVPQTLATVDLTFPEVQYLAHHLTKDECHRLVASLHFNSFKLEHYKTLEDAENALPDDVTCLKLLLHWNSDEGRGKTHEKLSLRLRQIGRHDLASWLDSAVLNELHEEIDKIAQEFIVDPKEQTLQPIRVFENPDDFERKFIGNDEIWAFIPSLTIVSFIIFSVYIFTFLANEVVKRYRLDKLEEIDKEFKSNQVDLEKNKDYLSSY